jgi:ribosomal 30S subunit maturation factor RimM
MDSENEQCVFTDSWKNYSKFVLCKLATVKDDNALFLITELTLAVLATLNPELYDNEAVIGNF